MLFGLLALCWTSTFDLRRIPAKVVCHLRLDEVPGDPNILWYAWTYCVVFIVGNEENTAVITSLFAAKACLFVLNQARTKAEVAVSGICGFITAICLFYWAWESSSLLVLSLALAPLWVSVRLIHAGVVTIPHDKARELRLDKQKLKPSDRYFKKHFQR